MKVKSKKLIPWTAKNYVTNIFVYAINVLLFCDIFALINYDNGANIGKGLLDFACLTILIFGVIGTFLYYSDRDFLRNAGNSEMIFLIMEIGFLICYYSSKHISPYICPMAFVSLMMLFLTDTEKSSFITTMFSIMIFIFDAYAGVRAFSDKQGITEMSIYFLIIGLTSGFFATYFFKSVSSRVILLAKSLLISVPAMICVIAPFMDFGEGSRWMNLLYALLSGFGSAICCTVILPIIEWIFKKVTCFKYAELMDHKSKYIKRLITEAPSTFNHSMVVANIAEACASAIGEDAMLARVSAYYHDIGKLRRPEMFKENQEENDNPHNELTPELSANIIRSHTQDGYKYMVKNRLPIEIADVAREHHGTMPILYFYDKAKKMTDGEVDISQFCYLGPKPQTKIAAIIMIADSSEAATRTLKDRSRENVLKVVNKIITERMKLGQFEECDITLKDLDIISDTLVDGLTGVYHKRIAYPKINLDGIELPKDEEE